MERTKLFSKEIPELEQTTLTVQEEQIFSDILKQMLPKSAEDASQFLESYRQEAQGQ